MEWESAKTKRPMIFLDLDGVLNIDDGARSTYLRYRELFFEPELVRRFGEMMALLSEADIILSSSWRFDMENTRKQLSRAGADFLERITGVTPDFAKKRYRVGIPFRRIDEIAEFVENHRVERFVIIDDDTRGMFPGGKAPAGELEIGPGRGIYVECDPRKGFGEKEKRRVLEFLTGA